MEVRLRVYSLKYKIKQPLSTGKTHVFFDILESSSTSPSLLRRRRLLLLLSRPRLSWLHLK